MRSLGGPLLGHRYSNATFLAFVRGVLEDRGIALYNADGVIVGVCICLGRPCVRPGQCDLGANGRVPLAAVR